MTPEEQRDIIEFRILSLQAQLQYMQDSDVQKLLTAFDAAIAKIQSDLNKAIEVTEKRARLIELLDNAMAMYNTVAVRAGETIIDRAATMAAYSAEKTQGVISWDGKVPGFNNVAMPASAYAEIIRDQEFDGKDIFEWTKSILKSDDLEKVKVDAQAAILRGKNPRVAARQFAASIEDNSKESRRHLETTYRTYTQTAAAKASEAVYKVNKDVVTEVEWNAVLEMPILGKTGTGTCVRCFTGDSEVFAPDAEVALRMQYDGIVYDFESPTGNRFSVTPNHPFLTSKGWVTADKIDDSVDIVYNPVFDRAFSGHDVDDIPTTFEQIFSSFSVSGAVCDSVPAIGSDFHGDAEFGDGYIDIVTADGFLPDDDITIFFKNIGKRLLAYSTMCEIDFSTLCESFAVLLTVGLTTKSITDGLSNSEAFGVCPVGTSDGVGFAMASNFNSSPFKATSDGPFTGVEFLADLIGGKTGFIKFADLINRQVGSEVLNITTASKFLGHLGLVSFDNSLSVEGIRNYLSSKGEFLADFFLHESVCVELGNLKLLGKRNFSGYVYDLQCFSTVYHVGGMCASNCLALDGTVYQHDDEKPPMPLHMRCRCNWTPVTKTWRQLGIDIDDFSDGERRYYETILDESGKAKRQSGLTTLSAADWFKSQPLENQQTSIGKTKAKLIKNGDIRLYDLVIKNDTDRSIFGAAYSLGDMVLLKDLPKMYPDIDITIEREIKLKMVQFMGTEIRADIFRYLENAEDLISPEQLKVIAEADFKLVQEDDAGWYNKYFNKLNMDGKDLGSNQLTMIHETGHYFDRKMGKSDYITTEQSRFSDAQKKDFDRIENEFDKLIGHKFEFTTPKNRRKVEQAMAIDIGNINLDADSLVTEGAEALEKAVEQLRKYEFKNKKYKSLSDLIYEDLKNYTDELIEDGNGKINEYLWVYRDSYKHLRILQYADEIDSDAPIFSTAHEISSHWWIKEGSKKARGYFTTITDLMKATTMKYGNGHSDRYFGEAGNRETEALAQIFTVFGDQRARNFLKEVFPNQFAEVERLLKEYGK